MSTRILGIDIGSTKICAVMSESNYGKTKIIGLANVRANGVKKGVITNIEQASKSIRQAVLEVERVAGARHDSVVVSISGKDAINIESSGIINLPQGEITIKDIERALATAEHNAKIQYDYEKIHTLPYKFKVGEQDNIEDPLGMHADRLEVFVYIIAVHKSALSNLKTSINLAGIKPDNIVLSGYASSISTLNSDEKELGVALVDMGGATCDMVIHAGNSIRYNEFLGAGSVNVTMDLSSVLHTPIYKAEEIKMSYKSLKTSANELIVVPELGNENCTRETSIELVSDVINARVCEILGLLAEMLSSSQLKDLVGAGVVLTGGMAKLNGIRELSAAIFKDMPVRIAVPRGFDGFSDMVNDPANSCAIGLCMYGGGSFTPYEIDSEQKLRYKDEPNEHSRAFEGLNNDIEEELNLKIEAVDKGSEKVAKEKVGPKEPGVFQKIWNYFKQSF